MRDVIDRFLDYVKIDTAAEADSGLHPSGSGEWELAVKLASELKSIGFEEPQVTDQAYVIAHLPATSGCEAAPALGLIAHIDTCDGVPAHKVKAKTVTFDGSPIELSPGKIMTQEEFPCLESMKGEELIVTDGTTLLGGDDKAGIAIIMSALETLIAEKRPHGKLCIAFTADEELGQGTDFFDVPSFGADFAYTVDGGDAHFIEYANFNAAGASVKITGKEVHPGDAKGIMRNAQLIGMEFNAMLPAKEIPAETSGREGFFHLTHSSGTVGECTMHYIIRDHSSTEFERRKKQMTEAAETLNRRYGEGTVQITITEQYRNMEEVIMRTPWLLDVARDAIRAQGMEPEDKVIRGGTDGARLSFEGLPCPNLGTGGFYPHGVFEFVNIPQMRVMTNVVLKIIESFSKRC